MIGAGALKIIFKGERLRVTFLKIYVKISPFMKKVLVVEFVNLIAKYGPVHPSIANILAISVDIISYLSMKSLLASKV